MADSRYLSASSSSHEFVPFQGQGFRLGYIIPPGQPTPRSPTQEVEVCHCCEQEHDEPLDGEEILSSDESKELPPPKPTEGTACLVDKGREEVDSADATTEEWAGPRREEEGAGQEEPLAAPPLDSYFEQLVEIEGRDMCHGDMKDKIDNMLLIAQSWMVQLEGCKYTKTMMAAVDAFVAELVIFKSMLEALDELVTAGQCCQVGFVCICQQFSDLKGDVKPFITEDQDMIDLAEDLEKPAKRRRISTKTTPTEVE